MEISVVIPTYNRKKNILSLLNDLKNSTLIPKEVIVVEAGTDGVTNEDILRFENLNIHLLYSSLPSVCVQRNLGIQVACCPWIFICDDDMGVPRDYLEKIHHHIATHQDAGAVSGLVLQRDKNDNWEAFYPIRSSKELMLKFFFGLSIWGEIQCASDNYLIKWIKTYYKKKENHISASGWPVITNISGDYFTVPVFGLGASLIRKSWVQESPYEERLDTHGIGDHYGVALGFPSTGIHIVKDAFVYHYHEQTNRLEKSLQYYRRVLALDYFISTKQRLSFAKRKLFLWSLFGNGLIYILSNNRLMAKTALKTFYLVAFKKNPYLHENSKQLSGVINPIQ
jgi:glycosyltransferase involved in cell wall biosynthesis